MLDVNYSEWHFPKMNWLNRHFSLFSLLPVLNDMSVTQIGLSSQITLQNSCHVSCISVGPGVSISGVTFVAFAGISTAERGFLDALKNADAR